MDVSHEPMCCSKQAVKNRLARAGTLGQAQQAERASGTPRGAAPRGPLQKPRRVAGGQDSGAGQRQPGHGGRADSRDGED
ncbi:hypothetical protein HaLaN_13245 [Haematococcus lacustris]|uniref:Uncharacterized protein n=1 Tax=Haematococcus lacustris TaxID=44745 RepID=A0A699ZCM2_HAELA|nr:hypothetical protein HaLaN_13245 [Haematococcus lacustris]